MTGWNKANYIHNGRKIRYVFISASGKWLEFTKSEYKHLMKINHHKVRNKY